MNHKVTAVAWMLALGLPWSARAAPDPQVMALEQQIGALQVDHALALTQQQAQALLPVLQSGKAQLQTSQAQRQAAQPALVAALTQAVSDLQTTGAISPATEQAVNAARPPPPSEQDLQSVWQQVQQNLTPAQLQALEGVKLGVPGRGHGPGFEGRGFGRPFQVMHVFLSDAFISLVQARAG